MNVTVAKSSGFCRGVQNAVDTAMRIDPQGVYILGELIHNRWVTDVISARGIVTVDSVEEVPDGAMLILRSLGVGKSVYDECEKKHLRIIDCTCPFVRRTQKLVERYSDGGYTVVVVGERTDIVKKSREINVFRGFFEAFLDDKKINFHR